jgi:subtilase family serine protease
VPATFSRRPLLALLASAAALLAPAAEAHGARFSPVVPRGAAALPAGARDLGHVSPETELRVTIALRPRHAAALAAYASAVAQAGSRQYHRYLTVAQFVHRFGPTEQQLRTVRAELRAHGLAVGATSANRLAITVRGTAQVTADAFGTAIDRYALRNGSEQDAPSAEPRLAGAAGSLVQGVVGLDSVAPTASVEIAHRRASHHRASHRRVSQPRVATRARSHASGRAAAVGPQACNAASQEAAEDFGNTAPQIASHYGLSGFYAAGDQGSGVTIALYELEPFSPTDIAAYQSCMGTSTTVDVTSVDGGPGNGSGSGEAATDIEDVIGLAPKATVDVYEGPPTGQGAFDTYSTIVSQDSAQVISTSWGLCEAQVGHAELLAEDVLFQEAAVQGQTIFAASGDSGVDDCGNGQLSVDDPGSQPWVTSVGGTHLSTTGDTVWNDGSGASGGGVSQFWGRPSWQTSAVAQTSVTCGASGTSCREVPDISADADPDSGYTAYFRGGWRTVGGTSVAAPTVASLAALAEASPGCGGRRLGFLDPALYADEADMQDVTTGDNSYDGLPGFSAAPGFDMASGLGTPTAALGPALCGDALSFTAPAAQRWTAGRSVSLALTAQSARGAAVAWSATGLPAGVSLGGGTGRLHGKPTASGSFTVTITAVDANGASESGSFTVTVAPGHHARHHAASHRHKGHRTRSRRTRHHRSRHHTRN